MGNPAITEKLITWNNIFYFCTHQKISDQHIRALKDTDYKFWAKFWSLWKQVFMQASELWLVWLLLHPFIFPLIHYDWSNLPTFIGGERGRLGKRHNVRHSVFKIMVLLATPHFEAENSDRKYLPQLVNTLLLPIIFWVW